jgi:uncharacterized linocin/CFP29 family protein
MGQNTYGPATVELGRSFGRGASGKWAGERFMQAIAAGRSISPSDLRTNTLMRDEEWKVFDSELIIGAQEQLRGVRDLIQAGLTKTISNGLGKTVMEYDRIGDMEDAIVSMDGIERSENDRMGFERAGLPLPITHKDFFLPLRALAASKNGSEPLDTTYVRVAGRKVGEKAEDMLFNGGKKYQGLTIYGYRTHPDRNTMSFGTNGNWSQAAKTGENILDDVLDAVLELQNAGHNGPYWMYVGGTAAGLKLLEDFKTGSDKTIRNRLQETNLFSMIGSSDKLPDNEIIIVQPSSDVVVMVEGEPLQTIQWDIEGGFQINYKAFQILVPLIRSDIDGNSGIMHIS